MRSILLLLFLVSLAACNADESNARKEICNCLDKHIKTDDLTAVQIEQTYEGYLVENGHADGSNAGYLKLLKTLREAESTPWDTDYPKIEAGVGSDINQFLDCIQTAQNTHLEIKEDGQAAFAFQLFEAFSQANAITIEVIAAQIEKILAISDEDDVLGRRLFLLLICPMMDAGIDVDLPVPNEEH